MRGVRQQNFIFGCGKKEMVRNILIINHCGTDYNRKNQIKL